MSAFLKLRALAPGEPAFLLESAEQGQRVGRWSFIGFRPRAVLRWSLADGGDPYALAAERVERFNQAPMPDARSAGGRHSPAARSASSAMTSCARSSRSVSLRAAGLRSPGAARHGADALRRAGRLRPSQAHRHDPRQRRPPGRAGHRARLRAGGAHDRRGARCARRAGPARHMGAHPPQAHPPAREMPAFESNMPREQFEAMVARIVRVHPRGRRLPGRALAALVGAGARRGVLDLPRPARGQPEPLHVLPGLRRLPGRGREPRAAADGQRAPRLHQADRRHAPARRDPGGRPADRRASCSPTRRSAPST